jgi:hypothetical protein
MGRPTPAESDQVTALNPEPRTLSAPGTTQPVLLCGPFNLTISGDFTGMVAVPERSFDGGVTYHGLTIAGEPLIFGAPMSEPFQEIESGVLYRLRIAELASGEVAVRFSR